MRGRHVWIDASAGIAGDMLLGALLDAGASLARVQGAVDAVVPGSVRITVTEVRRAGLRAAKAHVTPLVPDPPHRTWREIRAMLPEGAAARVFARLAEAEAAVHGVDADDVHFHEVGALDAIADVVGVCAALEDLGAASVSAGEVALGSGTARSAHGRLPVPVPAVAELSRGWRVRAAGEATGSSGELATPTGMALVRALASRCEDLPPMTAEAIGVGAGSRDTPGRANVVRVFVGRTDPAPAGGRTDPAPDRGHIDAVLPDEDGAGTHEEAVLLEANVDDLDPRLWPGVLDGLFAAGADDAWLTPIVMKKGRPAHTLSALCSPATVPAVRARIFRETSTLGVRASPRRKWPLARLFVPVSVAGRAVAVKIGHADGVIVQAMPEFADVAALARELGVAERTALVRAVGAATAAGLVPGEPLPVEVPDGEVQRGGEGDPQPVRDEQ